MTFDDKLRDIAPNVDAGQWKRIKQAFADERKREPDLTAKDLGLMTGQEWFGKFKDEATKIHPEDTTLGAAVGAAKKAAGIE